MSSLVVWHGLHFFFLAFPVSYFKNITLFTSCLLPHSISLSLFLLVFVCPLSLPLRFPSLIVVSSGSKSEYANAMVSGGAGVSQQGQNQVSMDTQTCLACKSNWCTTWPQEVTEHVPDHLMAEYPTPLLVRVERTTLVTQSELQQTRKQRFP